MTSTRPSLLVGVPGILGDAEVALTVDSIAAVQQPNGMIPWFPGGHADPWNHVEAAMALSLGGRIAEAVRAYDWLARAQQVDGSWCTYYLQDGIEEPRRDPNVCCYVATGVWNHFVVTRDEGFLESMFGVVERAIEWSLRLQRPGGEFTWSMEPDGSPGRFALLTSTSSISQSLRAAVCAAEHLGLEREGWRRAAELASCAVADREHSFEPKVRWAMDWYYPVLCGALRGDRARARLAARWDDFVIEGLGVRCVADKEWVTAAETAECAMALEAAGLAVESRALLAWVQRLRCGDGSYWTGWALPEEIAFPGGERSTYTAAAIVLAAHALSTETVGCLVSALDLA